MSEVLVLNFVWFRTGLKKIIYSIIKRTIDVYTGLFGVIALIPITIIVKISYMVSGDFNPVIFTQKRIGKNGQEFKFFKFRTMVPNADEILFKLLEENKEIKKEYETNKKLKNDPRITKVGKLLRKSSIDELPQMINIFFGDMSLIGNRPYLPRERDDMGEYYNDIVKTKPGLTGYWQVEGRSNTSFNKRLELEQYYSNHVGLRIDVKIFFKAFLIKITGLRKYLYIGIKRIFDVFASLLAIILASPVFLLINILIKLDSKGNVIYKHKRIGKNGKYIYLYKFRSMYMDSQERLEELLKDPKIKKEWEENFKLDNDPRITKVGNILRKTSLDELPQLFNILKGDMSLVGPRPVIDDEIEKYGDDKDKFLSVTPGLTGWWACNGRSDIDYDERIKLELYYVDHRSILLDIRCIFRTALAVFKKSGAK